MKPLRVWSLLPLLLFVACSDTESDPRPDAADAADMGTLDAASDVGNQASYACVDLDQLQTCLGTECTVTACRGDEVCQAGACVDWQTAQLSLDFTITTRPEDPLKVQVLVSEGGFPRKLVDTLRFDFGDGIGGWGEDLSHSYKAPGVYAVTLVVRLVGYHELKLTKLVALNAPADFNPLRLTINEIPSYLNGSEPAMLDNGTADEADDIAQPFRLLVPHQRFDINVGLLDAADPVDRSKIRLSATVNGVETDLSASILFGDAGQVWGQVAIRPSNGLPIGVADLKLSATTTGGATFEQELTVETVELTPEKDPFDRPMTWLLRDDLDFFSTSRTDIAGFRYSLDTTEAPNGVSDFLEELTAMGAQGPDEAINQKYMDWIRTAISTEIYRIFGIDAEGTARDEIEMKLVWVNDAGAPSPSEFSPAGEFSMMRLGGTFVGYLGYSKYAEFNEDRVDDSTRNYGVATAGILTALTSLYGVADAFKAIHHSKGFPVGSDEQDAQVFADGFDPFANDNAEAVARYNELREVARYIALALAPVIAHEMGHAMGLMPDGLPPEGFFGNRPDVRFVGARTNSHHTDLPGLNLMQAGGDTISLLGEFDQVVERPQLSLIEVAKLLSLETALSPLSRAYLQRKLTYLGTP